jgi:hypothetical protein
MYICILCSLCPFQEFIKRFPRTIKDSMRQDESSRKKKRQGSILQNSVSAENFPDKLLTSSFGHISIQKHQYIFSVY